MSCPAKQKGEVPRRGRASIEFHDKQGKPVYYCMQAKGPEKIVTPNGVTVSCVRTHNPNEATGIGYVPHWATCPRAGDFKRGGKP